MYKKRRQGETCESEKVVAEILRALYWSLGSESPNTYSLMGFITEKVHFGQQKKNIHIKSRPLFLSLHSSSVVNGPKHFNHVLYEYLTVFQSTHKKYLIWERMLFEEMRQLRCAPLNSTLAPSHGKCEMLIVHIKNVYGFGTGPLMVSIQ